MRKCNQKQCTYLRLGQGCRKCSFCSVKPFIVSEDCPDCYDCENIPNSCRWGDEKEETEEETNKEQEQEKKKKVIEVKAK
jgi:hypothetical protein